MARLCSDLMTTRMPQPSPRPPQLTDTIAIVPRVIVQSSMAGYCRHLGFERHLGCGRLRMKALLAAA